MSAGNGHATPLPTWGLPLPTPPGAETMEGVNNTALAENRTRIIDTGSWKPQNIVMILPAAKMVPVKCALSWMQVFGAPNNGLARWPADVYLAVNTEVGQAYSLAIENILQHPQLKDYQYILTVEHDNTPPQDGLIKLIRHMEMHPEFSCISGLYWTKGADASGIPSGVPQIWGDPRDPQINFRPQPPAVPTGNGWLGGIGGGPLVECCGTGMGFVLWRMSMFKDTRLRKPWFRTLASSEEGVGTQDLYFWGDARKWGYRCAVACDVLVGHFDHTTGINW